MSKRANRVQAEVLEPPSPAPGNRRVAPTALTAVVPVIVFSVIVILWITLAWFPLSRVGAHYQIEYNEGFSSYAEKTAVSGQLFAAPPAYTYFNYLPLAFHIVGGLSKVTGDVNMTGRWVSLAAYFAIAWFTALIVYRLSACRICAAFGAACWLIWLAAFSPDRIGYNDVHVIGMSLEAAGLYCFVRGPRSKRWLMLSGAIFAASLAAKLSLLSFPAAVAVELLRKNAEAGSQGSGESPQAPASWIRSRQRFWIWLGAGAVSGLTLLLLTFLLDGTHLLAHLQFPRTFSLAASADHLVTYFLLLQIPFAASVVWAFRGESTGGRRVLVWAAIAAHIAGAVYCTGGGAGSNHLYEGLLSLALIAGVAMPEALWLIEDARHKKVLAALVLLLPCFWTMVVNLPRRIPWDVAQYRATARREADFDAEIAFVKSRPGPAICENLLLCFEAGKPYTFDPFVANQLIETGKIQESAVLQSLQRHEFGAVQIKYPPTEPLRPTARLWFSEAFMRTLFAAYQPAARDSASVIFVPK